MEGQGAAPKKRPHLWVLIGGAVAVLAAVAWIAWWMTPLTDGERDRTAAPPPKAVEGEKAKAATDLPPLRALPPDASQTALPPLRALPPEETQTAPLPPVAAAPETPAAPAARSPTAPPRPVKAAPALPVTPAPAPVERATPAPPAQAGKRPEKVAVEAASSVVPGRYVGNISGGETVGLTLVISSVDGGAVKATASLSSGGACDGDYPMQGSARGGRLELRATRMGGRAGDCPLGLSLAADGKRMTGATAAGNAVQLKMR